MKITLNKEEVKDAIKKHIECLLFENGSLEIEFDEFTSIYDVTVDVKINNEKVE